MAIEFDCPACDATIRVRDDAAGKKGRCPRCKVLLLVPDPGPEEEIEQEPPLGEPAAAPSAARPKQIIPDAPTAPHDRLSVLENAGSMSTDTLPVGPDAYWTPPADTTLLKSPQEEAHDKETETLPPADAVKSPLADSPVVEAPFSFDPGPAVSPVYSVRRRRQSRSLSPTVVVAIASLLGLTVAAGFLYRWTQPSLTGTLTAERLRSVMLEPTTLTPPVKEDAVLNAWGRDGLPIRSEYVDVLLTAGNGQVQIYIDPGPQAEAIRLSLGDHAGVQSALAHSREQIAKLKDQEFQRAIADLFRDYANFLAQGTAIRRLPEYRNQVALSTSVGPLGYAVEAVVGGYPFPCVHEDSEGRCYFFLPKGTTSFQLRGRELSDGSTPLAVDFEVQVVEASQSAAASPEPEPEKPASPVESGDPPGDAGATMKEPPPDEPKP